MLESLGFSSHAETVYRLLLRKPDAADSEISEQLGLGLDAVAGAREQLISGGLVRQSWDDPGTLSFANPEVLDTAIMRQQAKLADEQARLSESRGQLNSLVTDYLQATAAPSRTDEVVELLGRDAIQSELEKWSRRAREEVLAVHPQTEFRPEQLASAEILDLHALSRGVKMSSIFSTASRSDPAVVAYHRTVARHGGEIRYTAHPPVRMLIFDRQAGIIPMHTADNGRAALLLRGHAVVSVLVLNFDLIWSGATPSDLRVPGEVDADRTGPSDRDRILLQLLSQGVKDEAAARHLGVSVRTLRRQIADLMARLEAGSRFEAGMQAATRGWLS